MWVQPTCLGQSSLNELASSSFQSQHAIPWTRWNWKGRKERKLRPFGLVRRAEAREPYSAILCVSFKENKTQRKRVLQFEWCSPNEEIERECQRVKKKKGIFFFAQVTHKEDKLVEFSWNFWVLQPWKVEVFKGRYWICGEIVFTPWDLFVVYPIYCGFKFSINLIVVISIL